MPRTSDDCKRGHGPHYQKLNSQGRWVCRVCMNEASKRWQRKVGILPPEPEEVKEPEIITRVGLANSYRR